MSSKNTNGTIAGAFIELCEELNASEEIIHVVGHLLLGDKSKMLLKNEKAPAIAEVVSFLAEAFITCTSHADLVILALDDVQWMDSASWNVIQSMFETGRNILILCGTRSLRSYHLSIHSDFWHDLGGQYKYEKRYFEMNMSPLTEADVLDLVAKSLSCRNSDIDEKVSKYIFLHSEGIPIFTSEIIRCCKKENLLGRGKNNKIQWITKKSDLSNIQFPTLDELITSRIDHLNDSVRKTLQIASVLGAEFDERDIRGVYGKLFGIQDENMTINDALSEAVDEGILEDTIYEEDEEDIGATSDRLLSMTVATDGSATAGSCTHVERKVYRFHHDTWLRVISSLLLKSFKRDIHLHAALALESGQIHSDDMIDYHSKLKLLRHWKGCGNVGKVSEIALEVGKMYKDHALFSSCTMVCEEAISLWKEQETEDEDRVAGKYIIANMSLFTSITYFN
jgi:predicted ATPase